MDFDTWTRAPVDELRVTRLAVGYVVGAIAVVATGSFVVLTSPNAAAEQEEPVIEIHLAKEPQFEPAPPPPPVVEEKPKPKPKPRQKAPIEIPKEVIKEASPVPQQTNEPDPFDEPRTTQIVETQKPVVVEAPKAVPRTPKSTQPSGPTRVLEDDTPPQIIGVQTKPDYPGSAKAAGLEGVVIVKYVISEAGFVTDAKVIKGPPEFHEACLTAVRTWRFKPALDFSGKPKAVTKLARFPFKLKT